MKNLISNTYFGKLLLTKHLSDSEVRNIRDNYDIFLSLLLEIWMFVPCKLVDGVWVVFKMPHPTDYDVTSDEAYNVYAKDLQEYMEAKDRCLFEGFEVGRYSGSKDNHFDYIDNKKVQVRLWTKDVGSDIWKNYYINLKTIEDLVKLKLELTPNGQKQIGYE